MTYTDKEIYDNRVKWINYLKEPERRKNFGKLENEIDNEARCCLGHGCHILGIKRSIDEESKSVIYGKDMKYRGIAPPEFVDMAGLFCDTGYIDTSGSWTWNGHSYTSLISMNDHPFYHQSPQEIGEFLESVILGGTGTPWKRITIE